MDAGFGGDQVVRYIPSKDVWVWVMQSSPAISDHVKQNNRMRTCVTSTGRLVSSRNTWTCFDLKPQNFGIKEANKWLDYPTVGFTERHLYISIDVAVSEKKIDNSKKPPAAFEESTISGRVFCRIAVGALRNEATSVEYETVGPLNLYKAAFTDNNKDRIYWAGLESTSKIRIWEWRDGERLPRSEEAQVSPFAGAVADYASNNPDGHNWLQKPLPRAVTGATSYREFPFVQPPAPSVEKSYVTFAWGCGRDSVHSHPYVRFVKFEVSPPSSPILSFSKSEEWDRWTTGAAYHFPALAWDPRNYSGAVVMANGGPERYSLPVVTMLSTGPLARFSHGI